MDKIKKVYIENSGEKEIDSRSTVSENKDETAWKVTTIEDGSSTGTVTDEQSLDPTLTSSPHDRLVLHLSAVHSAQLMLLSTAHSALMLETP